MTPGRNLLAGLTNSIWSALIGLAVVPFYLKYLGIEAYGLIGFFVTTQAVLSLLDMGMAPTINREVARCSALGNLKEAGKLLHTLALVYWSMAGVIALLILALAPLISGYWLQSKQLSTETISHAVMLMGLVVACRWPIGLYQGALMGAQRLAVTSLINIAMVTIGSLGAVAVLAFVSPTIEAFFIWQVFVGLAYAIVIRRAAWGVVELEIKKKFEIEELKRIWRFSAGMSAIALTGIVFTQLDKILLSKILGLEEFGHYMLATAVASGLYTMVTPMFNVMYPKFTALVVSNEVEKLKVLYRVSMQFLSSILFPAAMVLTLFSEELVLVWTANETLAKSVAPIIAFLSVGSALHGVMFLPYALQMAFGRTKLIFQNNIILMMALIPLIIIFSNYFGALGGAEAWFMLHILSTLLVTWQVQRYLLCGSAKWYLVDALIPLILSFTIGSLGNYLFQLNGYSAYAKLAGGCGLALVSAILSLLMAKQLRNRILIAIGCKIPKYNYS